MVRYQQHRLAIEGSLCLEKIFQDTYPYKFLAYKEKIPFEPIEFLALETLHTYTFLAILSL